MGEKHGCQTYTFDKSGPELIETAVIDCKNFHIIKIFNLIMAMNIGDAIDHVDLIKAKSID